MRKLVTVQAIQELKPIEGADRIEVARVKGWWVVVRKDEFPVGAKVLYFEIDSLLPIKPEYEFLLKGSKPKKMLVEGKEVEGIRLKTIKLKGQISQGLILPLPVELSDKQEDEDVSELLGVIKYEAPVASCLAGVAKGSFPSFIPKTDEERVQNMKNLFDNFYVTEKLDGTSVTFYKKDGVFGACSRNLELVEGDTTHWKLAKKYDLVNKLPEGLAIQGEIIGEGIQGNPLKQTGQDVYIFSMYNIKSGGYLPYGALTGLCNSIGIKTVPVVDDNFQLPKSIAELLVYADGKSALNQECDREGVVIRHKTKTNYKEGDSFKVISNQYLLKHE